MNLEPKSKIIILIILLFLYYKINYIKYLIMKNLSIVIITLNEELVIKRLLNNLLNQTYKNFEVIIVDSNSNDNTQKYATEFKNKFQEFEFIKMQNRGVSL
jgi:glycosyltransferase involved in cell wall biosynthesis